jgi:hypothetical protein
VKLNINMLYVAAPLFVLFAFLMMISMSLSTDHCSDCPSVECLCIQGADGNWMLSPEVGE